MESCDIMTEGSNEIRGFEKRYEVTVRIGLLAYY